MSISRLIEEIKSSSNMTTTENGAITNVSTLDAVLDFFYHAPSRRGLDEHAGDRHQDRRAAHQRIR